MPSGNTAAAAAAVAAERQVFAAETLSVLRAGTTCNSFSLRSASTAEVDGEKIAPAVVVLASDRPIARRRYPGVVGQSRFFSKPTSPRPLIRFAGDMLQTARRRLFNDLVPTL